MPATNRIIDDLKYSEEDLWKHALSPGTLSTYKTGFNQYLQFVTLCNLNDNPNTMPVISEDIMVKFVLFCANMLLLKWSTIKIYVAGIRFHYIKAGLNQPFQSWDRLHYMLNAVRRKQGNTKSPKRLPITFSVLNQLCAKLKTGVFSPHTDDMLQSVFKLAFFGFLRCGEFTIKSASDYDKVIRIKDVVYNQSSFTLHLRGSKTDPYHSGIKIYIASNIHLCPVLSMCKFIHTEGLSKGPKVQTPCLWMQIMPCSLVASLFLILDIYL